MSPNIRGIEFTFDGDYYRNIFRELLDGIDMSRYDAFIDYGEIHPHNIYENYDTSDYVGSEFILNAINDENLIYYIIHVKLCAYSKGGDRKEIRSYEDFLESDCRFILLIHDSGYFDIYTKDDNVLLAFIRNAISLKGENIVIKTDYDDGRTGMDV